MQKNYSKCHYDFNILPWLTSPRKQLNLQGVALGLINLPPDEGYTFTHTHRKQEEVYIVIKGSGVLLVDDELLELSEGDMVRVSPEAKRALKAHRQGMFVICSGAIPQGYPKNPNARYLIDDGVPHYDDIPPWYSEDPKVARRNKQLKERQLKVKKKRTPNK